MIHYKFNIGIDEPNEYIKKIYTELMKCGYEPIKDAFWYKLGDADSPLLLTGPAVVVKPASEKCISENPIEKDCGYLACGAHYRDMNLAITENAVYIVFDDTPLDDEDAVRNALKEEFQIAELEED